MKTCMCTHASSLKPPYKVSPNELATMSAFNPIALRKAKIAYYFVLSECNNVKGLKNNLGTDLNPETVLFRPLK